MNRDLRARLIRKTRTALHSGKPVVSQAGRVILNRAILARDLTQTALAGELGISRKHLSNLLAGKVPLTEPLLGRLCGALDVDLILVRSLLKSGQRTAPKPHGSLRDTVRVIGDPTEPMTDWELPAF